MTQSEAPVAVITGVSRGEGLGFETARQLGAKGMRVVITARDGAKAQAHAEELATEGGAIIGLPLDVTSDSSVEALAQALKSRFGRVDILINNASGRYDDITPTLETPFADVQALLDVTLFGAWRMIRTLRPLLLASAHPRIVNVTSESTAFGGGLAKGGSTLGGYAIAKVALNALTVKMASAFAGTPVLVNAASPGWIATYPGTAEMGARPVSQGAASILFAATLPDGGPSGKLLKDGKELAW